MTKRYIMAFPCFHRHLREIDISLGVVARPAIESDMELNPGAIQYTRLAYSAKVCFMAFGDITTSVNKGRRPGPMSSPFL